MKRSRFRKWAKWVGLAMCAVIVAAWVATYGLLTGYRRIENGVSSSVGISLGSIVKLTTRSVPAEPVGWFVAEPRQGSRPTQWRPYRFTSSIGPYALLVIPLWMPFLALAIPTAFLWHRDRRPPPNHCQSCGYNLTGNVSGVCPECGAKR